MSRKGNVRVTISGDASGLDRETRKAEGHLGRFERSGSRSFAMLKRAALGAGVALSGALVVGAKKTLDFDRAMRNVNSIAQLNEGAFEKLEQRVLGLAGKTAQSPKTLAAGLYDLVSSGFEADDALSVLEKSAKAATAGLTTTEVSTKAVAAVLNAYRLPASKAGKVSDQLFRTVDRGVISFEQLAENLGDVLPFASSLGIGLDQVGASVATMTKAGIGPAETMTRIKNVMVALLKPGADLKEAIEELGFESGEALVKEKGFQGGLEALIGTTDGSKASVAKLFPNIRALGGALALSGKNAAGAGKDVDGMRKSVGATDRALAQQRKSISFAFQQIGAAAEAGGIKILNKAVPAVSRFIREAQTGTGTGGDFRRALENAAAVAVPLGTGVAKVALDVARMSLEFAQSEAAVLLFSIAVGGLTGRLVGLAAAWAIGKAIAFATTIRAVGVSVTGLATLVDLARAKMVAFAGAGLGAVAGPIGILVGALAGTALGFLLMRQRSDEAKVSQQQLADAIRGVHTALDQIQDADLRARDAKLRHKEALLQQKTAEQSLKQLRDSGKATPDQLKEAELRVARARLESTRASREAGRAERDATDDRRSGRVELDRNLQTLRQNVTERRKHRDEVKREANSLRDQVIELSKQRGGQEKAREKSEELRAKRKELQTANQRLTDAERNLRGELGRVNRTMDEAIFNLDGLKKGLDELPSRKTLEIMLELGVAGMGGDIPSGPDQLKALGKKGKGGPSGLEELIDNAARRKGKGLLGKSLSLIPGGTAGFGVVTPIAAHFGLGVTSGHRPGDKGWHGKNRARDYGGSARGMLQFARFMAGSMGAKLLELIHTPLGFGIKNGKKVGLGFWGPGVNADHYDHVHAAMQLGGEVGGIGRGDRVPALLEPKEFVMRRRVVERFGPTFFNDLNQERITPDRLALLQSGGLVARAARRLPMGEAIELLMRAGFSKEQAIVMAAVGMAESSLNTSAKNVNTNGSVDKGWLQINSIHGFKGNLFDAATNARAARTVFRKQGFGAWVAYGKHEQFLDEARRAAKKIKGKGRDLSGLKRDPLKPGGLPSGFEDRLAEFELLAAQQEALFPEGHQAHGLSQLGLAREKRGMLKGRATEVDRRLAKIDKALSGKLRGTTRKRLIDERRELLGERTQLTTDLGQNRQDIIGLGDNRMAVAESRAALASLTPDRADDIAAQEEIVGLLAAQLEQAKRSGDPAKITEAANALKSASDNLASLKPSAFDTALLKNSADLAVAQLTDTVSDDMAALRKLETQWANQLLLAQHLGDQGAIIDAANQLKGIRDSLKSLDQEQQRRHDERMELDKQLLDERRRLRVLAETQGPATLAAVAAAVEGGIEGYVGLASRTPGVAGVPAAYRT